MGAFGIAERSSEVRRGPPTERGGAGNRRQRRRLQLHFRTFGPLWFSGHAVLKSSQRNRQAPLVDQLRFTRAADIERLDSTCKRRSPGYPQLLHAMSKTLPAVMLAAYCCKPSRKGIFAWKSVFRLLGSGSWIWRARRSCLKKSLGAQPRVPLEPLESFAFENQGCRIGLATLQRQSSIDQQAASLRLCPQQEGRQSFIKVF